jgi:hypothetical protein
MGLGETGYVEGRNVAITDRAMPTCFATPEVPATLLALADEVIE